MIGVNSVSAAVAAAVSARPHMAQNADNLIERPKTAPPAQTNRLNIPA
jgi:hypothetical protein